MACTADVDDVFDGDVEARLAESIRSNSLDLTTSSLAFAQIAIAATVVLLWHEVDPGPLMLWAGAQATLLTTALLVSRSVSPAAFLVTATVGEALCAVGWTVLPMVALPESPDWQVMQGVLLLGLLLSTLGRSTPSRLIQLGATLPLGVIGAVVFAVRGDGAAQWLAACFAIGLPFTIAAGEVGRKIQHDLAVTSLRNEHLAATLQREGTRLKAANRKLEHANSHLDDQARRDTLTGLYNRSGFLALLNQAVFHHPGQVVVCYVDLDSFKRVNDAFGHRFGDMILCAAANRLSRVLGPDEVLARQGGDEMTIFTNRNALTDGLAGLGRRILSVFEDPFLIENRQIEVSVSVGLVWLPEPTSADNLMRFADTALYQAKALGRNRFAIFDDAMRCELERRTKLQIELGQAFERSEITPYFQPIIDIETGRIATAEALARWERIDGIRPASDFIDTARHLGMLDRINDVVSQQVFEFQQSLDPAIRQAVPITVNVSPLHLDAMLHRVLEEQHASSIILEITEDGIFSDLARARDQLQRARSAGVKVLLDDFGVGFSSLSIATELPIDGFKIDRGFVASLAGNPSAVAAVEAIIQLAARMHLHVVAEGVETIEQLELLRGLGVGFAQGYLFSEAVPASTFAEWLSHNRRFDPLADRASTAPG